MLSGGPIGEGGQTQDLRWLDLVFEILRSKMNLVISFMQLGEFAETNGWGDKDFCRNIWIFELPGKDNL